MTLSTILCIKDLEEAANSVLNKTVREYFNDGSEAGTALAENISAFDRYKIRPRILRDVSRLKIQQDGIFGSTAAFPLVIAPSGMQCMAHPDGEKATARAAARAAVPMAVSTYSTTSLEDVKRAGDEASPKNTYMLQLYIFKDRALTENLVRRAERAGYKAVMLTCDTPRLGNRYNMSRNNFKMPPHLRLPNFGTSEVSPMIQHVVKEPEQFPDNSSGSEPDDALTWENSLLWLRSITNMDIWLKGVSTAEDVELAASSPAKVTGIVVSNHGGRQLESALPTLDSLPECVRAARQSSKYRMQVWVDGGIRRGSDIFKAIALGADGVMIGRIPLWGLAVGGEDGVAKALSILRAEFEHTMALAGCRTLADIQSSSLARRDTQGFYARL
ncbi:FMN-dependent dehydrogenase [Aspergillus heterothallicus]